MLPPPRVLQLPVSAPMYSASPAVMDKLSLLLFMIKPTPAFGHKTHLPLVLKHSAIVVFPFSVSLSLDCPSVNKYVLILSSEDKSKIK